MPLPWSADGANFGFSPPGTAAAPWLPRPDCFAAHAVDGQIGVDGSTHSLHRAALRLKRTAVAAGETSVTSGPRQRCRLARVSAGTTAPRRTPLMGVRLGTVWSPVLPGGGHLGPTVQLAVLLVVIGSVVAEPTLSVAVWIFWLPWKK